MADTLTDLSDADLRRICQQRGLTTVTKHEGLDAAEPWTRIGLAEDLRASFYARDPNQFEALLRVLAPAEHEWAKVYAGERPTGDNSVQKH